MLLAFLIFVPLYLHLAALMGERAPVFGLICTVTGLGIGLGMAPASHRIMQAGLDQLGMDVAVFSLQSPGQMVLVLWMGFGLLTTILLGIGFLIKGGLPRWTAVLLILAPIHRFYCGAGWGRIDCLVAGQHHVPAGLRALLCRSGADWLAYACGRCFSSRSRSSGSGLRQRIFAPCLRWNCTYTIPAFGWPRLTGSV